MKYCATKEKVENEIGTYLAYGIEIREKGIVLRRISDVFKTHREAKLLCRKCNRLKLDVEHIDDVVQDYLAE